jgi:hypothetical protein
MGVVLFHFRLKEIKALPRFYVKFVPLAVPKIGFSAEIKARPRLGPQATLPVVGDLRRGRNTDIGRKGDFLRSPLLMPWP